eukprot:gb/GFBE01046293.1/.p1 GENE.gb/GFBE01046293.1/~~gb/GFBE01046293.1/.p1  ORF type:complete len:104 (+),score=14.24 gb/GFBE01046293.1/:1-312(+)
MTCAETPSPPFPAAEDPVYDGKNLQATWKEQSCVAVFGPVQGIQLDARACKSWVKCKGCRAIHNSIRTTGTEKNQGIGNTQNPRRPKFSHERTRSYSNSCSEH